MGKQLSRSASIPTRGAGRSVFAGVMHGSGWGAVLARVVPT